MHLAPELTYSERNGFVSSDCLLQLGQIKSKRRYEAGAAGIDDKTALLYGHGYLGIVVAPYVRLDCFHFGRYTKVFVAEYIGDPLHAP